MVQWHVGDNLGRMRRALRDLDLHVNTRILENRRHFVLIGLHTFACTTDRVDDRQELSRRSLLGGQRHDARRFLQLRFRARVREVVDPFAQRDDVLHL